MLLIQVRSFALVFKMMAGMSLPRSAVAVVAAVTVTAVASMTANFCRCQQ
jgi:hypothetical protein